MSNLRELIGEYWDIAYQEGAAGRVWDQGGVAQDKLSEIESAISELEAPVQSSATGVARKKAAHIGNQVGVLVQNDAGALAAVHDLGRVTWLDEDVAGPVAQSNGGEAVRVPDYQAWLDGEDESETGHPAQGQDFILSDSIDRSNLRDAERYIERLRDRIAELEESEGICECQHPAQGREQDFPDIGCEGECGFTCRGIGLQCTDGEACGRYLHPGDEGFAEVKAYYDAATTPPTDAD